MTVTTLSFGAGLLLLCWAGGVLVAVAGRRHAAARFAGDVVPVRQVMAAQLTGTALNRVVPAGGGLVAAHLALLRRRGHPSEVMSASVVAYAAAGLLAHAVLLIAAGSVAAFSGLLPPVTSPQLPELSWPLLIGVGVLTLLTLVGVHRRRPGGLRAGRATARAALHAVRTRPAVLARLTALQMVAQLLMSVGLFGALLATGTVVSLGGLIVVFVLSTTVMAAVPAPGGTGPVELGLLAGLAFLAVPTAAAVAAVALFRLVTHWLPVPLGVAVAGSQLRTQRRRSGATGLPNWRAHHDLPVVTSPATVGAAA